MVVNYRGLKKFSRDSCFVERMVAAHAPIHTLKKKRERENVA